jgi:hypothetical protein
LIRSSENESEQVIMAQMITRDLGRNEHPIVNAAEGLRKSSVP